MNDDVKLALGLILIDADEFMAKLGLRSQSRFFELAKTDPRFPKAVRRGKRYSRWALHEADDYIRALLLERDQQPVAA